MNKIALFLALLPLVACSSEATYKWKVAKIVDGDTIVVEEQFFPPELGKINIRIQGIDTPESGSRAKCDKERQLAEQAKTLVNKLMKPGDTVSVSNVKRDKFGNRVVANVFANGTNIGSALLERKLARPYNGEKKQSWCD